ncbi:hypothetical protein G6F57_021141 [Rhizopus arrhizus]|nr:hypothetical protein G6F57_021141 [Rhizopus arrhizus]
MPAAEEAAVGRQRRRMRRLQHAMAAGVDDLALLLRIGAPEHEHQAFAFAVEHVHHVVGEALPAPPLVRAGLALFHGSRGPDAGYRDRSRSPCRCSAATAAPARPAAPRSSGHGPGHGRDTGPGRG